MVAQPVLPMLPSGVSPQDAARAYQTTDASRGGAPSGSDFGAMLGRAVDSAVQSGKTADAEATQAIKGGGDLTDVVQAVSRAELTLQTATAIRDRVVQAYQDIMKMPI